MMTRRTFMTVGLALGVLLVGACKSKVGPVPPIVVVPPQPTATDMTLRWQPNAEPDVAGYRAYHGTAPGAYADMVDVGKVTIYVWRGLTAGATHYFSITAYDTAGNESGHSAEVMRRL